MDQFCLPDVGEGLTEAEVVTWHVAEGDVVTVNQVLVDIETAKSVVELPSPFAGTVTALLVPEGTTVPVGTPIVAIGDPADAADAPAGTADAPAAEERQPVLVGYGPRSGATTRRRRRAAPTEPVAPAPAPAPAPAAAAPAPVVPAPVGAKVLAKPPVRKLAKDHGIDLSTVPAEGPVVTRADVEAAIASLREPLPTAATGAETRIPVKGVRRATAQAMVASAFTAPHVTEFVTLDVSATMELVERLRADRRFAGVKVSPTLVVLKAVLLALRRTPELNATWDEAAQEIVVKHAVNLGVAAATDRGLVVPNIRSAESMGLLELAEALGELTATARAGRTQPAQMSGGTFTVTNIGVFGIDAGTPILNPGETGILAVGQIDRRPWVVTGAGGEEQVVPRWVTTLALSFDHRVVDGEQGSRFLADVAAILRDPALALVF